MTAPRISDGDQVLVVCTGNICRSPFGDWWLRDALVRRGIDATVGSAGTHAVPGNRATLEAIRVADEQGIDLADHRATPLSSGLLRQADHVFFMEAEHAAFASRKFGIRSGGHAHVFAIDDPYGCSLETYRRCFRRIADDLARWL